MEAAVFLIQVTNITDILIGIIVLVYFFIFWSFPLKKSQSLKPIDGMIWKLFLVLFLECIVIRQYYASIETLDSFNSLFLYVRTKVSLCVGILINNLAFSPAGHSLFSGRTQSFLRPDTVIVEKLDLYQRIAKRLRLRG